jgi:NAD(P) transhydrogenase subunit beta
MSFIISASYFAAAVLFIIGLKQMASPVTARRGIIWAGVGMLIATLVTFLHPKLHGFVNYLLILLAIAIGGGIAWYTAKKVAMTDMPQMIALYNGMGGGSAAAIAAVELVKGAEMSFTIQAIAVLGALIGTVAFSGSLIAFAKLQGIMKKTFRFGGQQKVNLGLFGVTVLLGVIIAFSGSEYSLLVVGLFFLLALVFGVLMTLPIGGADMPVVISLYNALTGLAVGFEGFVLGNPAMMIAGIVVGAAGTLLTQLMAKAMNRPISNVLFSHFGASGDGAEEEVTGSMKPIEAPDAAIMMAYADKVLIIPGYGMAVAQAQHKIWELTQLLQARGVDVKFAIHPVAGRMPGHMNVLLAEAGVPTTYLRSGRDQRGVQYGRCLTGHRRERRGQPGRAHESGEPDLRHADPERRQVQERDRDQARQGRRLLGCRERAVLRRQHPHALRRRPENGQRADLTDQGARLASLASQEHRPARLLPGFFLAIGDAQHPPRRWGFRPRCNSAPDAWLGRALGRPGPGAVQAYFPQPFGPRRSRP